MESHETLHAVAEINKNLQSILAVLKEMNRDSYSPRIATKIDSIEDKILNPTERALIIEEAVAEAVKPKKQSK